jgi:deoxyribonuclease-4
VFAATLAEFDRIIGLDRLRAVHLNDSKAALGSRVDRHAPLGEGRIGLAPFGWIMRDPRFDGIPLILETPEEERWPKEIALLYRLAEA